MTTVTDMQGAVHDFFVQELMRNSLGAYVTALLIAATGLTVVYLAQRIVLSRLQRWSRAPSALPGINRKILVNVTRSLLGILPLAPVFWGLRSLTFGAGITRFIDVSFMVLFTLAVVRLLANLMCFLLDAVLRGSRTGHAAQVGIGALLPIVRTVVWALGITFLLDNLGFQISTIVAGLGIMGVAVGLAGQAILADFFNYIVILLDKPFELGDSITIDGVTGTVERIGIKTTRIRAGTGEMLIYPNSDMTKKQVGNQQKAITRVRVFRLSIPYETPYATVQAVPGIIQEVASSIQGMQLNRIHMVGFGPTGFDFEGSITENSGDSNVCLTAQQTLFFGIMQAFSSRNITFAYPVTRVVQTEAERPTASPTP